MEVLTELIVWKATDFTTYLQCLYILGAQLGNHIHAKNYPNIVMTQLVPLKKCYCKQ